MSTHAQGRGPVRDAVKMAAVFFAVGPLVGALTFVLTSVFFSGGPQAGIYGFGYVLIFAIPIGYLFGGPAAALTGLVVSIASHWITRLRWLYPFAAAVGAAFAVAFVYAIEILRRPPLVPSKQSTWFAAVMLSLVGSVAAVVCTWMMKGARVYKPTDQESESPGAAQ